MGWGLNLSTSFPATMDEIYKPIIKAVYPEEIKVLFKGSSFFSGLKKTHNA